jgi:hypothetical protein
MKRLIIGTLVVCVTIVLIAAAAHDQGYANYAAKDGFCVGAGGKLVKVGAGGRLVNVGGP